MKPKIVVTGGRLDPESQERLDACLATGVEEFHRILVIEAETEE